MALVLLVSTGGHPVAAASAAGKKSQAPPPPPPVITTTTVMNSNGSSASSKPSGVSSKSVISFRRRPLLDSGMRYSSNEWLITFISTPTSYVLRRIRFHLLSNVAICLAVIHFYPTNKALAIPMVGHTLLGSSLGLLLSYRTNSAYSRFWEARGHWTKTKSTCRNLAVTVKNHIAPHAPKASAKFLELLAAYPSALMHVCLGGTAKLQDHVQQHIPLPAGNDELFHEEGIAMPAIYLLMELHHAIHQACEESKSSSSNMVEALHLAECTHLIDVLMDSMSSCEKILRTPVPWTYSRHTSRFLTLWMGTLPFALVKDLSPVLTVAVVVAASYCMLGIEEISHLIEQPFLGDSLDGTPSAGKNQIFAYVDSKGGAPALITRGRTTEPYDIGIPVCSLAMNIRNEIMRIAQAEPHSKRRH
jgi:ion channel-forming bestrophin family protein